MACSTGCPTKDHANFGECMRSKGIQIDRLSLSGSSRDEARSQRAFSDYQELRKNGSQPASPWPKDVDHAKKQAMKNGVYVADV